MRRLAFEHDLRCRGLRDRLLGVEEASQEGEDVDHPHGHAGHEHEHEGAHDENTPHVAKGHDPLRRVLLSDDPAEHGPEEQAEHGHERGRKAAGKRGAYRLHDGVGRERAHDEAGDEERNRHRAEVMQEVRARQHERVAIFEGVERNNGVVLLLPDDEDEHDERYDGHDEQPRVERRART